MDKRLKEINLRLSEYSLGKFDKRLKISPRLDETDAIINGINMLGDELKAITISRDYFNNIFNSVTDMVFIVDSKGIIADANASAEGQLKYRRGSLKGRSINELHESNISYFESILKELKEKKSFISGEGILYTRTGVRIPVKVQASYFKRNEQKKRLILLSASDITFQKQTENLVLRAIIDTQEKERHRLAKDLHDSLTQQLSAIKFYVSSTAVLTKNPREKRILLKSNEGLTRVIANMRNPCFNLMPKSLEEFGLVKAVREFCRHFVYKEVNFSIRQQNALPELSPELAIDLYRIIQEFITNAIKHGKANKVGIVFSYHKKVLKVLLSDNGKGFYIHKAGTGMGLQNVQSRVKSHNGTLTLQSQIGKGTTYDISIPLNMQQ